MSLTDKEQTKRFIEAARKAEADTSDDALDRVFGKLDLKRKSDEIAPDDARQTKRNEGKS